MWVFWCECFTNTDRVSYTRKSTKSSGITGTISTQRAHLASMINCSGSVGNWGNANSRRVKERQEKTGKWGKGRGWKLLFSHWMMRRGQKSGPSAQCEQTNRWSIAPVPGPWRVKEGHKNVQFSWVLSFGADQSFIHSVSQTDRQTGKEKEDIDQERGSHCHLALQIEHQHWKCKCLCSNDGPSLNMQGPKEHKSTFSASATLSEHIACTFSSWSNSFSSSKSSAPMHYPSTEPNGVTERAKCASARVGERIHWRGSIDAECCCSGGTCSRESAGRGFWKRAVSSWWFHLQAGELINLTRKTSSLLKRRTADRTRQD